MILSRLRVFHFSSSIRRANATIHAWAEPYVDKALAFRAQYLADQKIHPDSEKGEEDEAKEPRVLIYEMAKQTGDRMELRSQILQVFMASYDSTSALLSNIFFLLSRHPKVYAKVRAEALTIPTDTPLTFELLRAQKYTRWVINESTSPLSLFDPLTNSV